MTGPQDPGATTSVITVGEPAVADGDRGRGLIIGFAVVGVLALAALGALIAMIVLNARVQSTASMIDDYRSAGADTVEAYIDFSYESIEDNAAAIEAAVDGIAADRFAETRDQWVELAGLLESVSDGEVLYAGVQDYDDESAMVLVLGRAMVSNKQNPVPEDSYFPMRMLVERSGDKYRVINMEYANL